MTVSVDYDNDNYYNHAVSTNIKGTKALKRRKVAHDWFANHFTTFMFLIELLIGHDAVVRSPTPFTKGSISNMKYVRPRCCKLSWLKLTVITSGVARLKHLSL